MIVDDPFDFNFELPVLEFCLDFFDGPELVGVMYVNEVGFDVVRNSIIVLGFPEGSLSGSSVKKVPTCLH